MFLGLLNSGISCSQALPLCLAESGESVPFPYWPAFAFTRHGLSDAKVDFWKCFMWVLHAKFDPSFLFSAEVKPDEVTALTAQEVPPMPV